METLLPMEEVTRFPFTKCPDQENLEREGKPVGAKGWGKEVWGDAV